MGFRVFEVGLGFRVECFGIWPRVWGLGFSLAFWVQGFGIWLRFLGLGFRDLAKGFGFRVFGFDLEYLDFA